MTHKVTPVMVAAAKAQVAIGDDLGKPVSDVVRTIAAAR